MRYGLVVAVALALSARCVSAQGALELAAGIARPTSAPGGTLAAYRQGMVVRGAFVVHDAGTVGFRASLVIANIDQGVSIVPPCAFGVPNCHPFFQYHSASVAGLNLDAMFYAGRHDAFYLATGAGLYQGSALAEGLHPSLNAAVGAQFALPEQCRIVAEVGMHGLIGDSRGGVGSFLPATLGFQCR